MNFKPIDACIPVLIGLILKESLIIWLFKLKLILEPPIKIILGDLTFLIRLFLSTSANKLVDSLRKFVGGKNNIKVTIKTIRKENIVVLIKNLFIAIKIENK
jgi:hypothetical protein